MFITSLTYLNKFQYICCGSHFDRSRVCRSEGCEFEAHSQEIYAIHLIAIRLYLSISLLTYKVLLAINHT